MTARTLLAMVQGRKYLGELMLLEDLFAGLDRDRWNIQLATLWAPNGEANELFDGRRVPAAFFEQGSEVSRAEAFDLRPDCLVFCNWQRDLAWDALRVRELVELVTALRVPVALTDSNNQARYGSPGQTELFSAVDLLLTPCVFNTELEPSTGLETVLYRPADHEVIRRHRPADPARLGFLGAASRPRICVAVSSWADHVGRVPGPTIFQTVMERLHARFADSVEVLVMGRHVGDLASIPGAPIEVPLDLGFAEASEVLATVDLLISFNINSQAAARVRWFGGRVLFVTSKREDIRQYGFRDMMSAPAGTPSDGWAVLIADELDHLEALAARLLERERERLPRDVPSGAERIETWMAR
jgi:hypothetical protein